MATSIFGTLTRYGKNPRRNRDEERLTEAFAATLRAAPNAARSLTEALLRRPPPGEFHVATQRRTREGDRVDIELRFGTSANPELLVWLELKWAAPPCAEQLDRYDRALRELGHPYKLALIDPRGVDLPGRPDGASVCSWQDVGRALAQWHGGQSGGERDAAADFLVREFLLYLNEEGLAVTDAFSISDALALARYGSALSRVEEIIDIAGGQIAGRWTPRPPPGVTEQEQWTKNGVPWDFWRTYDAHQAGDDWPADHYWLEWHGRLDTNRAQPRHEPVFGAGVTSKVEHAVGEAHRAWIGGLEALGFEWSGTERVPCSYLFRYLYPAELVSGVDLEDQARRLADWVCETFETLRRGPPPPAPSESRSSQKRDC